MNSSEIISISILWCIGLLALIQALNARGAIRVSLTWIITVVIVLIAIVITYIQISNNDPPLWAKSMSSTSVSTSSEATSKKDTFRLKAYALSSKKLSSELESLIKSIDRKSTRLNSSHVRISYAVFCLKKKKKKKIRNDTSSI